MDDRRAPNTRAIQQTDRRHNAYQRRRSTRPVRCWIGQIPAHVACGTAVCPKSAGWRRNQHPRRRPRFIGSPMPVDADMGGRGQACAVFICSQGPRGGSGRSPAPCIGGAADAGRRAGAASVRRWGRGSGPVGPGAGEQQQPDPGRYPTNVIEGRGPGIRDRRQRHRPRALQHRTQALSFGRYRFPHGETVRRLRKWIGGCHADGTGKRSFRKGHPYIRDAGRHHASEASQSPSRG